MSKREHSTGYARISETAEGSNVFEMFIGKQGANGTATFTASLKEDNSWEVTDTRDSTVTTYRAKVHGGGNTQDTPKIAQSMIDQIAKKFMSEKKEKVAKEPKEKGKPGRKPKAKAEAVSGGQTEVEKLEMLLGEPAPAVVSEEIAEGETALVISGKKFNYDVQTNGTLQSITVSRGDQAISTSIGLDDDVMASVTELAQRLGNDFDANLKAAKRTGKRK